MGARTIEIGLPDDDRRLLLEVRDLLREMRAERDEALLSTDEAAALARVKPVTIRSWVHLGKLPVAQRAGNRLLFRRDDILSLTDPQSPAG